MPKRRIERINLEERLTEKEEEYVKKRAIEEKNKSQSYREAYGYLDLDGKIASARANAIEKREPVQSALQRLKDALKAKIVGEADGAFDRIVDLSKLAEQEGVRLAANKDILDRAGFKEPIQLETMTIFNVMSPEQIKLTLREAILKAAEEREKQEAIDITPENAATFNNNKEA